MPYENSGEESPLERKRKVLQEKVSSLEDALSKAEEIKARWESENSEHEEISLIMDGLYKKAKVLSEEEKTKSVKMPETDQEWDAWIARTDRIANIYMMIADLSSDLENTEKHISAIESEFKAIEDETKLD